MLDWGPFDRRTENVRTILADFIGNRQRLISEIENKPTADLMPELRNITDPATIEAAKRQYHTDRLAELMGKARVDITEQFVLMRDGLSGQIGGAKREASASAPMHERTYYAASVEQDLKATPLQKIPEAYQAVLDGGNQAHKMEFERLAENAFRKPSALLPICPPSPLARQYASTMPGRVISHLRGHRIRIAKYGHFPRYKEIPRWIPSSCFGSRETRRKPSPGNSLSGQIPCCKLYSHGRKPPAGTRPM